LNQEGKLAIHFNTPITQVLIPNADEAAVVRDIVEAIHKICVARCFDDFYQYYKRISVKSRCDFKYMFSLIRSYCKCAKIVVADRVGKNENVATEGNYDLKTHLNSAELIQ
jgi:hypothetical protein